MGKSAAANWANRWARGTASSVPNRAEDSRRKMTAGSGGAKSPDACDNCGHANLNKYCECCQGGCR